MFKITELGGKKLIDIDTARDLGEISCIAWNKALGSCALVTDEGCFSAQKIFSAKDAVSVVAPTLAEGFEKLTLDKSAYDTTGKYLGKLAEVEFGNTLKIASLKLDDGTVCSRGKLYAASDVLLIRARTPATKTAASKPAKTQSEQKTEATQKSPKITTARWLQNRRYGDFSFLIGKKVDKSITNFQGELMVKKGQKVSNTVLRQAKLSGKLIELCLHTK